MGIHNKDRRRAKKSARARSRRDGRRAEWAQDGRVEPPTSDRSPWRDQARSRGQNAAAARELVAALIYVAAHAACESRADREQLVAQLVRADFGASGERLVADELEAAILGQMVRLIVHGWEPIDLWEIARRRAGSPGAGLLAGLVEQAVARVSRPDEVGGRRAQCAAIEAAWRLEPSGARWPSDVVAAVDLVELLGHLPPLGNLAPVDGGAQESDPERAALLSKIRRLLAKAESTGFAAEADSYTAKATELMHRHRIDRAAVEANTGVSQLGGVTARRFWIDAPYVEAKCLLVDAVANANGCKAVHDELGFMTVVGAAGDIEMTELLFTSLLVQATQQMRIAGTTTPDDVAAARRRVAAAFERRAATGNESGPEPVDDKILALLETQLAASLTKRKRTAGFRRTFLVAYASRIRQRLAEAGRVTTDAAAAELGTDFLPVLARQQRRVDHAVERLFGRLETSTVRVGDAAGWAAGTAAADLADLNVRDQLRTG